MAKTATKTSSSSTQKKTRAATRSVAAEPVSVRRRTPAQKTSGSQATPLARTALENDLSTEEKIKETATRLFMEKGYDATKTRDIAEAAGINIALLNYYYRSKENLFGIVSDEALKQFFGVIIGVMNKPVALEEKITLYVETYTTKLLENPMLPLFVLSCIQNNPERLPIQFPFEKNFPVLEKQLQQLALEGIIRPISIFNFFGTLTSSLIFPFLLRPILATNLPHEADETDMEAFRHFVLDRKKLIVEMFTGYVFLKRS